MKHTLHNMTHPDDLNLRNMIEANPDGNMSHFASLHTLSSQCCLLFQFLAPSHIIGQYDDAGASNDFPTDAIQFEEVKTNQWDGDRSFKLGCVPV
jgi:hypothetical protein